MTSEPITVVPLPTPLRGLTYVQALKKSLFSGGVGLLLGGMMASVLLTVGMLAINSNLQPSDWLELPEGSMLLFLISLMFSAPVTFLLACPVYALLLQHQKATWLSTLVIGLVVVVVCALAMNWATGLLVAWYGLPIALITHLNRQKRDRRLAQLVQDQSSLSSEHAPPSMS